MDDGLLIEQVQGFPAIWNKKDSRFTNKIAKEQAWITIAEILGCSPEDCEQRWKILRAKYAQVKREVRETPSGSAAYTITWPHYEAMGFINPFLVPRRTVSNMKVQSSSCRQSAPSPSHWDTQQFLTSQDIDETQDQEDSQEESESDAFSLPPTPTPAVAESAVVIPTSVSTFKAKMAVLKNGVKNRGTKRSAQEVMCETLTSAIGDFRKKSADDDKNGLLSWSKSLANDMQVLSTEEQIKKKKKSL